MARLEVKNRRKWLSIAFELAHNRGEITRQVFFYIFIMIKNVVLQNGENIPTSRRAAAYPAHFPTTFEGLPYVPLYGLCLTLLLVGRMKFHFLGSERLALLT